MKGIHDIVRKITQELPAFSEEERAYIQKNRETIQGVGPEGFLKEYVGNGYSAETNLQAYCILKVIKSCLKEKSTSESSSAN